MSNRLAWFEVAQVSTLSDLSRVLLRPSRLRLTIMQSCAPAGQGLEWLLAAEARAAAGPREVLTPPTECVGPGSIATRGHRNPQKSSAVAPVP